MRQHRVPHQAAGCEERLQHRLELRQHCADDRILTGPRDTRQSTVAILHQRRGLVIGLLFGVLLVVVVLLLLLVWRVRS